MAGDYAQMDHDLPDCPEFLAIVEATGESVEVVFYRLFLLWRLVDRHILGSIREHHGETCGVLAKCGPRSLAARCGGTPEFWLSVAKVTPSAECPQGWLIFDGGDVLIPGWNKRFSNTAKRRKAESRRKKDEYWATRYSDTPDTDAEGLRRKSGERCGEKAENDAEELRRQSGESAEKTSAFLARARAGTPVNQNQNHNHYQRQKNQEPIQEPNSSPPSPPLPSKDGGSGRKGHGGGSGGGDDETANRWKQAADVADAIARNFRRCLPDRGKHRRLVFQAAWLSLSEPALIGTWLDDAIEDTLSAKPLDPWSYFRACLSTGCQARDRNLDKLLASVTVPTQYASAPKRPSPPPDSIASNDATGPPIDRDAARAAIADARASVRLAAAKLRVP